MKGSIMEKYVHNALQFVFPKNCFEELMINFNIFHPTCPKMVLSRVLGLGITAGSILLFVPQIIKIFSAKSAKVCFFFHSETIWRRGGAAAELHFDEISYG
ncbi:hypothetical protein ANCCAN_25740 [Ancylostoma caninum]|uniref:Uncharacterized protein n=1 Tax=Ancylostoma caninum TaxID=29170 RepID=A0A368F8M7_ANCCA|nr:hypothetical protein ANCCAN_25740 [Ancylostoma caninum]